MSGDSSDLVDLDRQHRTGPLWGIGSEDLNATPERGCDVWVLPYVVKQPC